MHDGALINSAAALGRILIALIFVVSGLEKLAGFGGTVAYITAKGIPFPELAAALTIALEVGGGICLMLGWKVRLVAALFFLWLIPTTLVFHAFSGMDPAQAQNQETHFLKNVSIMGAMAMLFAFGPGAFSVDRRRA
jgi:putative oxidoreductase